MNSTNLLEGILNNLAEKSSKSTNHEKRKKTDKIAYACIREFCDSEKVKYWDNYYQDTKRSLDGNNKNRN